MTGTVRVTGLAQTRAALARVGAQIRAAAEEATDEAAEAMADQMRADVPVRTGQTRSEIGVRDGDQPGTKEVGAFDSDHGGYVEFGTEDTPAQPFVTPASEAERRRFPDRVGDKIKGAIE